LKRIPDLLHLVLSACFIAWISSQCQTLSASDVSNLKLKNFVSQNTMGQKKNSSLVGTDLIDNSINPDKYFVGGGDVFSIHILELPSVEYMAVVDQNCDAVIPELGIIRIGKKSLTQAKDIITDFVKSRLKKSYEVYVALSRAKSAVVTITGAVTNPGTYQMEGTSRIFDAIRMANGNVMPAPYDVNYREVQCINKDSSTTYDLFKFLMLNDNNQNPYLYPGDNICISLAGKKVLISGNLKSSYYGNLPIKSGETAKDFLSLFTMDGSADMNNIIITKHDPDSSIIYSMLHPQDITLTDKDIIIVPQLSNYPRSETVKIMGEINRPGTYPLIRQVTTGRKLLDLAGGSTNLGNIERAFIIRREKINIMQKSLNPVQQSNLTQQLPTRTAISPVRPEINSAIVNINASNDYSVIPLDNKAMDELLEPNDEIVVPETDNKVYVSGRVKSPGAYPFVKGKKNGYFIETAGGFSSRADKTNIFTLTQYGENFQIREDNVIDEGDVIVVPESQQYKYMSTVLLPIISIFLSAVSTAMVLYYYMNQVN
jgi:protein involved in polysaccharide export with SLBB domain